MGLMTQATKDAEAALKKENADRHERNLRHMADLAKIRPSPTITEVQAAMGYVAPVSDQPQPTTHAAPSHAPASHASEHAPAHVAVDKTSEAEAAAQRAGYKTRASKHE